MANVSSIGTFGNFGFQKQDPDIYAKQYAEKNNISLEEAKEELKAKYGDPRQGMENVSFFANQTSENSYYDLSSDIMDFDENFGENMLNSDGNNLLKGLFQKFLDFLKNGNGPKKEGDPQSHINPETNTMTGPTKEGDPQFRNIPEQN